jgi:uncharacterized protein YbjT (DUF2867 family)
MKAIVIGSTGLVGGHLLELLHKNPNITEVVALVRKQTNFPYQKVTCKVLDFDNINPDLLSGDILFCALGTTIKKAGSKETQYRVDFTYNAEAARIAKSQGVKTVAHVSSIGANSKSSNFYLRTKGELEQLLTQLGFEKTIIARPSIILGERNEFRLGEKIGIVIATLFAPLMVGKLKKYRGVHAQKIARCLIIEALNGNNKKLCIFESDVIQNY